MVPGQSSVAAGSVYLVPGSSQVPGQTTSASDSKKFGEAPGNGTTTPLQANFGVSQRKTWAAIASLGVLSFMLVLAL